MNSTATFSVGQKAALPIVFVPCAIVCFIVFRYAKRRLQDTDTMGRRMEYLYSALSASLLGHLLFRILPEIPQPFPVVVGVGFFVMLCVQKCAQSWRDDPYTTTDTFDGELYYCVDRESTQIKTNAVQENLLSPEIPEEERRLTLELNELRKRRKIAALLFVTMLCTAVIEGLLLPLGDTVVVAMFYASKLLQTLALSVAWVHAFLHAPEEGRWPWYFILSLVWCVTCALSTLPGLLDFVAPADNVALLLFYALAAGIVLWVAQYFIFIDRTENNMRRTVSRLVVFGVVFVATWVTSFFV